MGLMLAVVGELFCDPGGCGPGVCLFGKYYFLKLLTNEIVGPLDGVRALAQKRRLVFADNDLPDGQAGGVCFYFLDRA